MSQQVKIMSEDYDLAIHLDMAERIWHHMNPQPKRSFMCRMDLEFSVGKETIWNKLKESLQYIGFDTEHKEIRCLFIKLGDSYWGRTKTMEMSLIEAKDMIKKAYHAAEDCSAHLLKLKFTTEK